MFSISIYALLYGDFNPLHRRILHSLISNTKGHPARINIWCNQVCERTLNFLQKSSCRFWDSKENVPKYKAMRKMFSEEIPEPWVVWFDDDSWIVANDWFPRLEAYVKRKAFENLCCFGERWTTPYFPGEWEFITQSWWYQGKPPLERPGKKPGYEFITGSYWWLRTDILRMLDWPDPRLNHNGGDTLLSEALRQIGLPVHPCRYGIKANDAPRRGYHEAPPGSRNPKLRR